MRTSVTRLNTPVMVNDRTWFPHLPPGIVWSQLKAKGRQMRQPATMVAMAQAVMKPIAPLAVQMTSGTAKTLEYSRRMEILQKLRLRAQRNWNGMMI